MNQPQYFIKVERADRKGRTYHVTISKNAADWNAIAITFDSFASAYNMAWAMIKSMRLGGLAVEDATNVEEAQR